MRPVLVRVVVRQAAAQRSARRVGCCRARKEQRQHRHQGAATKNGLRGAISAPPLSARTRRALDTLPLTRETGRVPIPDSGLCYDTTC